jgi:type IV secretion system protein VirB3
MDSAFEQLTDVQGFTVPVHRALTEPILLAGAPRAFAILNGTLAGAIGLGLQLWLAGIVIGLLGHLVAVWPRGAIRSSSRSGVGICAFPVISRSEAEP